MRNLILVAALPWITSACFTTGDLPESVSVEGIFSFQREITISSPKGVGGLKRVEKYGCINGLFGPAILSSEEIGLFENQQVYAGFQ